MKTVADKVYTKRQAGIYRIGYQWEIGDDGLFTVKLTQTSNRFIEDTIKTRWDNTHRDVARSKAYKAERSSWIWKGEAGLQLTIKQANAFLQSVLKTQWFQRRYSSLFCGKNLDTLTVIYPEYYRRTATGGRAQLFLPEWARTKTIILHELAHLLKARALPYSSKEGKSYAGHGRAWAWIFADLVHRKIGKAEGDNLRANFRIHKCPFNKRRKGNNFNPFIEPKRLVKLRVAATPAPVKNWTHVEALKAAKVFRKHKVPCRVYQTKQWNGPHDSYLVVYREKDGKTYELNAAYKECRELCIEAEFKQLRQS